LTQYVQRVLIDFANDCHARKNACVVLHILPRSRIAVFGHGIVIRRQKVKWIKLPFRKQRNELRHAVQLVTKLGCRHVCNLKDVVFHFVWSFADKSPQVTKKIVCVSFQDVHDFFINALQVDKKLASLPATQPSEFRTHLTN
jgi:hypothetical protein